MIEEKKEDYLKAFVELNEIINHMDNNIKNKIPQKMREAIKDAGDKKYKFNYNNKLSLSKQNLLPETKSLLSVIYSDYLCSKEEKKKWEELDKFEMQKREELKVKKYNVSNLFESPLNNKNITVIDERKQIKIIDNPKESFWSKIKKIIIKLFKK